MDAAEPRHKVKPHCTISFEVGELVRIDLVTQVTSNHLVVLQRRLERVRRKREREHSAGRARLEKISDCSLTSTIPSVPTGSVARSLPSLPRCAKPQRWQPPPAAGRSRD